jgi:hypothetical protein
MDRKAGQEWYGYAKPKPWGEREGMSIELTRDLDEAVKSPFQDESQAVALAETKIKLHPGWTFKVLRPKK